MGCAILWFTSSLIACPQSTDTAPKLSLEETKAAIAAASGDAQRALKFDVLKRHELLPITVRRSHPS